jgi:hypothetical protein
MSRWILALLFAFGSVTFLTGCPAEEDTTTEEAVEDAGDAVEGAVEDAGDAVEDATDGE